MINTYTYTDEHLDYWGEVFSACRLHELGVTFSSFIASPWEMLALHGQESAPECLTQGYRPLLPRQAAIARRIREEEARTITVKHAETPAQTESNVIPFVLAHG